jgi:hypothetical protein
MKKESHKYLVLIIFILASLISASCREEVISPKNNGGNVNEPFKSSYQNSYTFILNAENLSQFVIDYPNIIYSNSRIFVSVADYTAGSVEVVVLTKSREVIYRNKLVEDNNGSYEIVKGIRPEIIEILLNGFTGKLKVQLTGVL